MELGPDEVVIKTVCLDVQHIPKRGKTWCFSAFYGILPRFRGIFHAFGAFPHPFSLRRGLDRATITERRPYAQVDDVQKNKGCGCCVSMTAGELLPEPLCSLPHIGHSI